MTDKDKAAVLDKIFDLTRKGFVVRISDILAGSSIEFNIVDYSNDERRCVNIAVHKLDAEQSRLNRYLEVLDNAERAFHKEPAK